MISSSKPYLLRAIYEWLLDNQLTPYIMVDATLKGVRVPERFIQDGKIVLNIEPQAVAHLQIKNESVEFDARFSGVSQHIFIPMSAVKAIYSYENGRGMAFNPDEEWDAENSDNDDSPPPSGATPSSGSAQRGKNKPGLKIVK